MGSNKIVLKMPKTESDANDGINNGSIETYKNTPILSLTKEELQNSTDSALKDCDKQVIVEFNDFYINSKDLPDYEHVLDVFCDERDYWDDFLENDKKAIDFFDKAIKILKKDKIRCLRISDFNTTGLTGIDGKSTPWKNLVKNRGVSDKEGGATGSFGIGKDAAFACSDLRMVFYNTISINNEKAFQGTLKLPSYQKDDNYFEGFGFFSLNTPDTKTDPVLESISIDPDYTRDSVGMDKFIIGFRDDMSKEDLKKLIIASSINNYLYAFYNDILIVKYGDTLISKENLEEIFSEYQELIDDTTKDYYKTLKEPEKEIFVSVFEENDVRILIRLDPDASRRAAVVRKTGMKVFDKGSISGRIYFSAVVILLNDKVNEYFKKLENPEHTQWSEKRSNNQAEAKRNINLIFDTLRKAVSQMHSDNYESAIDADGVNQYLPYSYVTGKKNTREGLSVEVDEKKHAKKKKKPTQKIADELTYEVDEFGTIIEDSVDVKVPESDKNTGVDSSGGEGDFMMDPDADGTNTFSEATTGKFISRRKLPNENIKFALSSDKDGYYLLRYKVCEDIGSGFLEILVSCEDDTIKPIVSSATINDATVDFSSNKIAFDSIKKDEINVAKFNLHDAGDWALEVTINENTNK